MDQIQRRLRALDSADSPLSNIELHNLNYASRAQITQLVTDYAPRCLAITKSIPKLSAQDADNAFAQYRDASGKVLVLEAIYAELLELVVADLTNPFRREFVLNDCMIRGLADSLKIKSHIDELIYMQEL